LAVAILPWFIQRVVVDCFCSSRPTDVCYCRHFDLPALPGQTRSLNFRRRPRYPPARVDKFFAPEGLPFPFLVARSRAILWDRVLYGKAGSAPRRDRVRGWKVPRPFHQVGRVLWFSVLSAPFTYTCIFVRGTCPSGPQVFERDLDFPLSSNLFLGVAGDAESGGRPSHASSPANLRKSSF